MRTLLRSIILLCTLANLVAATTVLHAQVEAPTVSRAELESSGAANLYEAIARLRPDWLLLAGDTVDAAARQRVLVYVDGRHLGTVDAFRTLSPDAVGSVRLRSRDFVRRTMSHVQALFHAFQPIRTAEVSGVRAGPTPLPPLTPCQHNGLPSVLPSPLLNSAPAAIYAAGAGGLGCRVG